MPRNPPPPPPGLSVTSGITSSQHWQRAFQKSPRSIFFAGESPEVTHFFWTYVCIYCYDKVFIDLYYSTTSIIAHVS